MSRSLLLAALALVSCAPSVVPDTTVRGLTLPVRDPTPRPLDDDDPRETPPESDPFQAPALPAPQREKLGSGAELLLQGYKGSSRVELRLIIKGAGSDGDGPSPGLASLALRACLEGGTLRFAGKDVTKRLGALGVTLERVVISRAATIRATIPQKNVNEALGLLLQTLREPRFDPGEVNRIRRLEQGNPSFQEAPERWLRELEQKELLQPAPAQPVPRGAPGPAELRAFWKQHYGPGALSVVLVGDVDVSPKATLEQGTATWKATPSAAAPRALISPRERHRILLLEQPEAPSSDLWILAPGPAPFSEGWASFELLGELLGGPTVGRLALATAGSPPLALAPEVRLEDRGTHALLNIHTNADPTRVAGALGAMLEALRKTGEPPGEAELQGARRRALAALQREASTPRTLADLLEQQVSLGAPDGGLVRWSEQLQKIEGAQVSKAAKSYLSKGILAIVTGNSTRLGPLLQRFGEVAILDPAKSFEVTKTLPEQPAPPPTEGR